MTKGHLQACDIHQYETRALKEAMMEGAQRWISEFFLGIHELIIESDKKVSGSSKGEVLTLLPPFLS